MWWLIAAGVIFLSWLLSWVVRTMEKHLEDEEDKDNQMLN
jgi:hypothetical protein